MTTVCVKEDTRCHPKGLEAITSRLDLQRDLEAAKDALDRADRDLALQVIRARTYGYGYDRIAGILNLSSSSVRSRYAGKKPGQRLLKNQR